MDLHPNHQKIIDALTADPTPLIRWAAMELVALGAKEEWDLEDNFSCTEGLAELAGEYRMPLASDQSREALHFYGAAAAHLGFRNDIEDEVI